MTKMGVQRFEPYLEKRLRMAGWFPERDVWDQLNFPSLHGSGLIRDSSFTKPLNAINLGLDSGKKDRSLITTPAAQKILAEFGKLSLFVRRGKLSEFSISFIEQLDDQWILELNNFAIDEIIQKSAEDRKELVKSLSLDATAGLRDDLGMNTSIIGVSHDTEYCNGAQCVAVTEKADVYLTNGEETYQVANCFDDYLNASARRRLAVNEERYPDRF